MIDTEATMPAPERTGNRHHELSLLGGFDNPGNIPLPAEAQGPAHGGGYESHNGSLAPNPRTVREARLELLREAIFENLGAVRLFAETAQLLIEARDDAGVTHAVHMGVVDWDYIEDRTREIETFPFWEGPANIVAAAADGYRENLWLGQKYWPEIFIEKTARYFARRGYALGQHTLFNFLSPTHDTVNDPRDAMKCPQHRRGAA